MKRNALEAVAATFGNLFAWFAHSEQIWFGIFATYVRDIAPAMNLPDLRGPFLFLTLVYLGLRIGDLWDRRDEIDEDLT